MRPPEWHQQSPCDRTCTTWGSGGPPALPTPTDALLVVEDLVSGGSRGSVSSFGQDLTLHAVRVAAGDLVFGGCGNQNLAIGEQQLCWIVLLRSRETMDRAIALPELPERFDVDAVLVVKPPAHFADADDLVTGFGHQAGSIGTDVAKALNDDAGRVAIEA